MSHESLTTTGDECPIFVGDSGRHMGESEQAKRPLSGASTPLIQGADDHYRLRLRDRMTIVTNRLPERHLDEWCSCAGYVHRTLVNERFDVAAAGCWAWRLRPDSNGYGVIWHKKRAWLAHRFAYEAMVGRIPDGLSLDHLCRNRMCVNPSHLEPVTYEENCRRARGVIRHPDTPSPVPNIARRDYRSRDGEIRPNDPRHGSTTGYNSLGCRCQRCRDAHAAYAREWHNRRASA